MGTIAMNNMAVLLPSDQAVDAKIQDQVEVLEWWDKAVGSRRGLNRHNVDNAERGSLPMRQAEAERGISQQQVSRWRSSLADTDRYRSQIILAAYRQAGLSPAVNYRAGSGDNEWHTPLEHIAAARNVLGEIDLDPASNLIAQETVRATNHYTRADNSLSKEWHGRVWLNPPYAQPLINQFVQKLVDEFASGRVTQAIMLTNNYTDTAWFQLAAATAALICFPRGRINFINVDGSTGSPTQGQAIFYYGTTGGGEEFRKTYSAFGLVVRRA
jgi:ParB family chromosome partitioning protein